MKILLGVLAGCAGLACVGAAVANSTGLYLGGGAALRGTIGDFKYVGAATPLRPKFDVGPAYMINLGYRLPNNVRVEGELGYASNSSGKASPFRGTLEQWTGIANIAYDFPITDRLALTVGGGGGYVWTLGHLRQPGSALDYFHRAGYAPVWQVSAGLAFEVTEQLEMYANYRYQDYGESQHTSSFTVNNPVRFKDAHSHMFMVGFRFFPEPLFQYL